MTADGILDTAADAKTLDLTTLAEAVHPSDPTERSKVAVVLRDQDTK
jgi:hypothetical protein